jgi:hypothetical protein
MWDQSEHALEFFRNNNVPFWNMANQNTIVSNGWCLGESNGNTFVVYLSTGGTTTIDLAGSAGTTYSVQWFNPRTGGSLQDGSITSVAVGSNKALGSAPGGQGGDWVILLTKNGSSPAPNPTKQPTPSPNPPPVTTPNPTPAPGTPDPTPSPVSPAPTSSFVGSVASFSLIDASTDQVIRSLSPTETNTINLAVDGSALNIRALTTGTVGSVLFGFDADANFRTENVVPFALGGDINSNYASTSELTVLGLHTVTATPFSQSQKNGAQGSLVQINLNVVNNRRTLRSVQPVY